MPAQIKPCCWDTHPSGVILRATMLAEAPYGDPGLLILGPRHVVRTKSDPAEINLCLRVCGVGVVWYGVVWGRLGCSVGGHTTRRICFAGKA
jgi:hypothetical protein